jgi:hypothetical protein
VSYRIYIDTLRLEASGTVFDTFHVDGHNQHMPGPREKKENVAKGSDV